ncbi:hypothetical protein [Pseudaminobacter soli (ex Li et al. 2025)]|uniref:Uncharacterized protein n=1 Tax=Pseudaminobacter soli (ex Li et al. 2025) TaxID=1295366 RepID=A0A2P7S1I8_9HYPH|nr:hypothetical protein [Mesorhizobium soli]PSJ56293.1 hypothetical protein C7I85_25135 [Mesorhizobium soli]
MAMTRDEVVSVLGPVDEQTIAEIVLTGASLEELREAWAWTFGDEALMNEGRPLPGTKVAALIDLIEPAEDAAGPLLSGPR